MTPERWREIERVYHAALERDVAARAVFLAEACAGDEALRREVESLLAQQSGAAGFLSTPASARAVEILGDGASLIGRTLGPYAIQARLGAGGMGEVYRARDSKLGRDVAIKILPTLFTSDPDRLRRFEREARVLASLNHPHIGAIYGLESIDGTPALVLELVDGDTLAERIARGPLPVADALAITTQIALALEAAHERGVVHRDLKPANIKITPAGVVKVLDFGLAKAAAGDASNPDLTHSPTITVGGTREGVVLGTAAYMSPEQARGQAVDKRTDIWAFGCVFYEMLTGRLAFGGATVSDAIAAILQRDPDWSAVPASTPVAVRRVLRRCLEKDATRRLRDIADARLDLDDAGDTDSRATTASARSAPPAVWAAAAVLVITAAAFGAAWFIQARSVKPDAPVSRFLLDVRPAASLLGAEEGERTRSGRMRPSRTAIALSPDGRTLAFTAVRDGTVRLYRRSLSASEATAIPGTENADGPFFSPDGAWIGFWSNGALRKVSLAGGPPVTVCEIAHPQGASWSAGGRIVFANTTIWSVPAGGGTPKELTSRGKGRANEARHVLPQVLPGGKWLLFTALPGVTDWDHTEIVAQSLDTGERRVLLDGAADARYLPTGYLAFMRLGNLMVAPFDPERAVLTGSEAGSVEGIMQAVNAGEDALATGAGQYAFSEAGTLVFIAGGIQTAETNTLAWVNRNGSVDVIPAPTRSYFAPRLSPDGRALVVGTQSFRDQSAWRYDFAERTLTRLTTEGRAVYPVWSRDGKKIFYGLSMKGPYELFSIASDGGSAQERLVNDDVVANRYPNMWTSDGKSMVIYEQPGYIKLFSPNDRPQVRSLIATSFSVRMPDLSPDEHWLAYVSNETGRNEVYVQAFPGLGGKRQISTDGGVEPAWSRDGHKLAFLRRTSVQESRWELDEADVTLGASLVAGPSHKLFDVGHTGSTSMRAYDLTPDAGRFLFVTPGYPDDVSAPREIQVVQNWFEELKARVPGQAR